MCEVELESDHAHCCTEQVGWAIETFSAQRTSLCFVARGMRQSKPGFYFQHADRFPAHGHLEQIYLDQCSP